MACVAELTYISPRKKQHTEWEGGMENIIKATAVVFDSGFSLIKYFMTKST